MLASKVIAFKVRSSLTLAWLALGVVAMHPSQVRRPVHSSRAMERNGVDKRAAASEPVLAVVCCSLACFL